MAHEYQTPNQEANSRLQRVNVVAIRVPQAIVPITSQRGHGLSIKSVG